MWNPLSWVMEAAAIMAIAMAHGGRNMDGTVNLFLLLFFQCFSLVQFVYKLVITVFSKYETIFL